MKSNNKKNRISWKRIIATVLSLSILLNFTAYASTNREAVCQYYLVGHNVIEELNYSDSKGSISSTRVVEPTGRSILTMTLNGETTTLVQNVNYNEYKALADLNPNTQSSRTYIHNNSNFIHKKITESTNTVEKATVNELIALGVSGVLAYLIKNAWAGVAANAAANHFLNKWTKDSPDYVVTSYSMNEVTFAYDGVYYCYCYEYSSQSYDSQWHKIGSAVKGDVQTIG